MYLITDPNEMRPDERFLEVVWIVANGVYRIGKDSINKSIDSSNPDNRIRDWSLISPKDLIM